MDKPTVERTCSTSQRLKLRCSSLHVNSLLVSVKGGVRKAFAVILSKELAVTHSDVVDLVARATSVHPLPLLRGLLSFSAFIRRGKVQSKVRRISKPVNPDTFFGKVRKSPHALIYSGYIIIAQLSPHIPPELSGSPGSVTPVVSNRPVVMTSDNDCNCSSALKNFNGLRDMLRTTLK